MGRYAFRRVLYALPMLALLSLATFGMLELAPGDAGQSLLATRGNGVRTEDVIALREQLGLNDPLPQRYVEWLAGAARLDFGTSYRSGREVRDMLRDALGPTLFLQSVAFTFTVATAVTLGLVAGVRRRMLASRLVNAFVVVTYSTPGFLVAIFGILVFSVALGWLPATGMTTPGEDVSASQLASHVVLPALALTISHHLGSMIRVIEAAVTQARGAPHTEAARARGVGPASRLVRYTARSAMVPFAAQLGTLVGATVAGAYAIEAIFSWPGVGRVALEAANGRDYPVLTAVILLSGVAVILANVLADVTVALLDPRVRLEGERRVQPRAA